LLLSPVASLYGAIVTRRIQKANPHRSRLPVICVGNFTAGGSGKTPLALLLAKVVAEEGREPWFLSRGYGGASVGPVRVDAARHSARDVGDEPLLLARKFPAVVARDRRKGAEAIEALASNNAVIIMDDGLQNPALIKDLSIAVVDAKRGFGNGRIIPAGPLRAPLIVQAPLVQLVVVMGKCSPGDNAALGGLIDAPVISAETRPADNAERFRGQKVLAFAGIANPDRFFSTLDELGADIVAKRSFKDHHSFSEAEAQEVLGAADRSGALLVTTEKDFVRLSGSSGYRAELQKRSETLAITTAIGGEGLDVLRSALRPAIRR
jgi:tetraacyldisaccharide 4'-kinase